MCYHSIYPLARHYTQKFIYYLSSRRRVSKWLQPPQLNEGVEGKRHTQRRRIHHNSLVVSFSARQGTALSSVQSIVHAEERSLKKTARASDYLIMQIDVSFVYCTALDWTFEYLQRNWLEMDRKEEVVLLLPASIRKILLSFPVAGLPKKSVSITGCHFQLLLLLLVAEYITRAPCRVVASSTRA